MSKYNLLYLSGILLFVIYSCNSSNQELTFEPPHFKDTLKVEGRIINDIFIMGLGYDIDFHNDILMVAAHKGDEGAVHFFNIPDGTLIKSILPKGRGPGEAMIAMDLDVNHQTGEVVFYDYSLHKLNCFNIDSVVKHEQYKDHIVSKPYLYMYAVYHGKDNYIAKGGLKSKDNKRSRFSIIDNDSVIFRYGTFPKVTVPNIPNGIDISYKYCHTSVSPQKSKLVCASGYGAILEIFDINKNSIDLETIKGFYKPVFDIAKNNIIHVIPNKTIGGFKDLYVTENYIYTIFNSIPYDGTKKLPSQKQIAVFDWKGNATCLYQCNYDLNKISVNEQTNKLYAIGHNENHEPLLVEFNLNR